MPKSKDKKSFELSFEEAYEKLETIAETLESGNLTLEEATNLYENGITLAKMCGQILNNTELKIQKLRFSFSKDTDEENVSEEYDD
ncbi:MAG: exodeoxyribonuclease VII small subunit [Dehalococcoidia bacterium]|nr:exodeoxyribonuclease VII small subunit [Dehalococcoidia bacterium]|tara:strand:- start:335 stop:592 length:258 start_codon:yes stop_codon:yes gene_type:complete